MSMQAIITKVLNSTDTKSTRIKAKCRRGAIIIPVSDLPEGNSFESVHAAAAKLLCEKFIAQDNKVYGTNTEQNFWNTPFVTGQLDNGNYVHVFTN